MDSQSILTLAKQGDANAIAALINNSLKGRALSSNSTSGSGNCYEQAGEEILQREGNKVMNKSDMERYYSELRTLCG
jgi:hypothetical protein